MGRTAVITNEDVRGLEFHLYVLLWVRFIALLVLPLVGAGFVYGAAVLELDCLHVCLAAMWLTLAPLAVCQSVLLRRIVGFPGDGPVAPGGLTVVRASWGSAIFASLAAFGHGFRAVAGPGDPVALLSAVDVIVIDGIWIGSPGFLLCLVVVEQRLPRFIQPIMERIRDAVPEGRMRSLEEAVRPMRWCLQEHPWVSIIFIAGVLTGFGLRIGLGHLWPALLIGAGLLTTAFIVLLGGLSNFLAVRKLRKRFESLTAEDMVSVSGLSEEGGGP